MYTTEESCKLDIFPHKGVFFAADPHFAQPSAHFFNDGRHGGEDVGIWAKGPYAWSVTINNSSSNCQ